MAVNKGIAKLLIPQRYDGESVMECKRYLAQLTEYLDYNTDLATVKLQVQVAISLLDGKAREWGTPFLADYAAGRAPFATRKAFTDAFTARFGHLDDAAAAQVELTKICARNLRDSRTAAQFSAQLKGPADRSGYGKLELRDKYLSGIPSRIYRKIELEPFDDWVSAEKRVLAVEQILDISRARRPDLNMFARGGARTSQGRQQTTASSSTIAAVGDGKFNGSCYGCGKPGYRRKDCPSCKDKPYTPRQGVRATVAASAATPSAQPEQAPVLQQTPGDLSAMLASVSALANEVKSMREELGQYRAMKEERF